MERWAGTVAVITGASAGIGLATARAGRRIGSKEGPHGRLKAPTVEGKYFGVYAASKSAIRSLTDSTQHELINTKIRVSSICPGLVKTEIFEQSNFDFPNLDEANGLNPEEVAYFILEAIKAPGHVRI